MIYEVNITIIHIYRWGNWALNRKVTHLMSHRQSDNRSSLSNTVVIDPILGVCLVTHSCPALLQPDGLQPARLLCK